MSIKECIKEDKFGLILKIRIIPSSSKSQIIITDDMIKIKVTAPPVENKANKALTEYLAKYLKIPKTSVTIIRGETSKEKMLRISVSDSMKKAEILNIFIKGAEKSG